jgi:hypothetical protein
MFTNSTVMSNKVPIALALSMLTADSVPTAGHRCVAIRVADACWVVVDSTLTAVLLAIGELVLTGEVTSSADALAAMVALASPIAGL